MTRSTLLSLSLLCLVACSQEVPQVAAPPAPVPTPAVASPAQAADVSGAAIDTADSAQLSVVFVDKPACTTGEAATVIVKWDVVALGAKTVSVFVESPANPKKLWVDAGASGEGTTGKWVYDQTRFTVQDRDSGKVLATRLLEKPCTP